MGDVIGIERRENSVRERESDGDRTRRLIRDGWSPRVRSNQTIWRRPGSPPQFFYSQEVALAIVEANNEEMSV